MPDTGDHDGGRARNRFGHEAMHPHARIIVLADDQERRHTEGAELRRERVDRGPLREHLARGVRDPVRAVGHETGADETLRRRAPHDVAAEERVRARHVRERLHAVALRRLSEGAGVGDPRRRLVRAGARIGDDQGAHPIRVPQREVERDVAAHRKPADGGATDLQEIEQRGEVRDGDRLRVPRRIARRVRDAVSTNVIRDHAETAGQRLDLEVPAADPAREAVDEHERRTAARHLVVQRHAVDVRARHRADSRAAPTNPLGFPRGGCEHGEP